MDRQDLKAAAEKSSEAVNEPQNSGNKLVFATQNAAAGRAAGAASEDSSKMAAQGKLGKLDIVDTGKAAGSSGPDGDSDSDHIDVGKSISWSIKAREDSRPQAGQGYYDVMQKVGGDLLGKAPDDEELKLLVAAAKALEAERGKNPDELKTHDELLPKNETELSVFLKALENPDSNVLLGPKQIQDFKQGLDDVFQQHEVPASPDQIQFDMRPVRDQPVVTKVVPDAVYIDSSNITGGQGYRRKPDCSPETQTYWLAKPVAEAFLKGQKWLIDHGHNPMMIDNMNGAGRRALDRELISKCAPGQIHATKHSTHENGISVDIDNYSDPWVRKALAMEGFVHNVPPDHPHYTWLPKN